MNPSQLNFKASIENLESLGRDYIQANKTNLESRSIIQFATPSVSAPGTTTTSTTASILINDYVRTCRIYCIMLWTYWEAFDTTKASNISLEELRLIRNCLVHHEGDLARYSQDPDSRFAKQGARLTTLTTGKAFVQGYNLIISDAELTNFTNIVKTQFQAQTGFAF